MLCRDDTWINNFKTLAQVIWNVLWTSCSYGDYNEIGKAQQKNHCRYDSLKSEEKYFRNSMSQPPWRPRQNNDLAGHSETNNCIKIGHLNK